jgi:S1-C subfamily serine protease
MNGRTLRIIGASLGVLVIMGIVILAGSQASRAAADAAPADVPAQLEPAGSDDGVVVVYVDRDSPAAQAGVKRGDILMSIDDEAVNTVGDVRRLLAGHEVGDEVSLIVMHGDERRTLTASLGEHFGQPYLGLIPVGSPRRAAIFEPGATITEVTPDSPAAEAGLQPGDRIVAIDGDELTGDLAGAIGRHAPGDRVTLTVERPGQDVPLELTVTLGEHPDKEGAAYLGVTYAPQPFIVDHRFGGEGFGPGFEFVWPKDGFMPDIGPVPFEFRLPDKAGLENGLIVGEVSEDSPASAAGLQTGDIITAIDGEPVAGARSLQEAVAAREPGDTIALTISRDGESQEIEATLAEHPDEEGRAYLGVTIAGFFGTRTFREDEAPEGFQGPRLDFRFPFDRFFSPFEPEVPPVESQDSTLL